MTAERGNLGSLVTLLRFPTFITAFADCAAGYALAGGTRLYPDLLWLAVASMSVYCFALVLNDVCDREYDRIHYPARPLPSGKVKPWMALMLAFVLVAICFASAIIFVPNSFRAYVAIAAFAVAYNLLLKRSRIVGAMNLAICRFLNFYAGFSAVGFGDFTPVFYGSLPAGHVFLASVFSSFEEKENRSGAVAVLAVLTLFWIFCASLIESPVVRAVGGAYLLLSFWFAARFLFMDWKPHLVTVYLVWGIVVFNAGISYSSSKLISFTILSTLIFSLVVIFKSRNAGTEGSR